MRKAVWVGAVLFTLLAVGVLVLFWVDFDSPALGARLLREVSARAGVQITAEGFHLNLVRGLRLDKVRLVTESPSGRLTVTADGLLAEHRLAPLLRGKIEVDRVVLYTPRIELVTPPTAGAQPPAAIPVSPRLPETVPAAPGQESAEAASSNIALRVGRIKLEDGVLLTRTEGSQTAEVEIRGLGVELRDLALDSAAPTAVQAFSAEGDLRTAEILVGGLRAVEGAGQIKLGAGHFRLEKFNLKLPQGPFLLGEFDADLNRDPFAYRFACQLDPLDTNGVLTAGKAKGFGPGKLVFTARGTGTETRDMIGDGTLAIAAGQVPGSPVFTGIEAILGRARLTGSSYAPFTVRFHIEHDRLAVEPFELRTSVLALGLHGWADLAGPVDLRIAVKAPRDLVSLARVSSQVLDAVAADGMVTIPLRVTGTPDRPHVTADSEALRAMGGAMVRREIEHQVRRGVGKLLGRIFGN